MEQAIERWRAARRRFFATLRAFWQTADALDALPLFDLRQCTDDVRAFLAEVFLPQASGLTGADQAELTRLSAKLEALSERLLYSYFGPAQLGSLGAAVDDLDAIIERHLLVKDEIGMESGGDEVRTASQAEVLTA